MVESDDVRRIERIAEKAKQAGFSLGMGPGKHFTVTELSPGGRKTWEPGVSLDIAERLIDGDEDAWRDSGLHAPND